MKLCIHMQIETRHQGKQWASRSFGVEGSEENNTEFDAELMYLRKYCRGGMKP